MQMKWAVFKYFQKNNCRNSNKSRIEALFSSDRLKVPQSVTWLMPLVCLDSGLYNVESTLHNVLFVQYLYLATEQAGTYLQSPLV